MAVRYRASFCKGIMKHYDDMRRNEKGEIIGMPSLVSYAAEIGTNAETLRLWRGSYPEFDKACLICEEKAEQLIIDNALCGRINITMAKLILGMKGIASRQADERGSLTPDEAALLERAVRRMELNE